MYTCGHGFAHTQHARTHTSRTTHATHHTGTQPQDGRRKGKALPEPHALSSNTRARVQLAHTHTSRMHKKDMDIRPAARMDVDPLLRTDPHSGHMWCSSFPVHVTEPRSVAMRRTMGSPMRTDGTAGNRYTQGRDSMLGTVSVTRTRPSGEWTGAPHSTLPSRTSRPEGRNAKNDWMNSVAQRGHQSRHDVHSTVCVLAPAHASCFPNPAMLHLGTSLSLSFSFSFISAF